jgi:hypothetical protein
MKWIGTQTIYDNIRLSGNANNILVGGGTGTLALTAGDMTLYDATNDGNPTISLGSSDTNRFEITGTYNSGAQTLLSVDLKSYSSSSTANDGKIKIFVDEVQQAAFNDSGLLLSASKKLTIGSGNDIISDSSGTTTLSNIDALDATTTSTISSAISAGDITGVTLAGDSGSASDTSGNVDLTIAGGTNATTSATGTTVTVNVDDAFLKNDADDATTGTITSTGLIVDGDKSITPGDGAAIHVDSTTITDSNTSASGTASRYAHMVLEGPILAATNVSVTTTDAATLYLRGAPSAGDNQTITNAYSLWVDNGNVRFDGTGNTVGTITSGTWQGTAIASAYLDADTAHLSGTQTFSGTKTFSNTISGSIDGNAATVTSASGSSDANHTLLFTASSAGATTVLQDAGILYNPSSNLLTVGDLTVSGTSTTIGTVTSGTWEGTAIASDQQKHLMHYRFMGYGTGDGTNYFLGQPFTDNQAPLEHADSSSSDGLTIPAGGGTNVSELIRSGGHVMARAVTLKKWTGWATYNSTNNSAFVGLFKWTPVDNDSTDITPVLLDAVTITGKGNDKVRTFAETSFTQPSVSAGDIIFTQIKTDTNSKIIYFNSTLEVEF